MNKEQQIDKTDYYRLPCGRFLEDFIYDRGLGFAVGNAMKYLMRAGNKPGEEYETALAKATHYMRYLSDKSGKDDEEEVDIIYALLDEAYGWDGRDTAIATPEAPNPGE